MNKKSTTRYLALLLPLALFAAACGGDSADSDSTTTSVASTTTANDTNNVDDSSEPSDAGDDMGNTDDMGSTDNMDATADTGTADEVTPVEDDTDNDSNQDPPPAEPPVPPTAPGFDGETIKVAVLSDLSGPAAIIGTPLTAGGQVYYDYVNSQGGIAGRYMIETVEADHGYNPATAVQVYNGVKDEVTLIGQLLGTPITNAVLESLKQDGVVAAPGSLDAFWVPEENLLPIGSPYQIQAINGLDWWIKEGGGTTDQTYCAFVQDDPYGEAGLEGLEFAAQNLGFSISATATYVAGDLDFSAQMQQLSNAGCEVVYLVTLPSVVGGALGTAVGIGFAPTWIAASPVWVNLLALSPLAPYLQQNMIIVGEGSTWGDPNVAGMGDMIERLNAFAPDQDPDYYFTFGYLQAHAVVQLLEAAVARGDLSRQGIINALNELGEVSFLGLGGDYFYGPPGQRVPSTENTIFRVDPAVPNGVVAQVVGYEASFASDFEFN